MSILPFQPPALRHGFEVSPGSLVQLQDSLGERLSSHLTTTIVVTDGDDVREFLTCLTCKDGGFDVAIEVFSEDASHLCPVEGAERIYRELLVRLHRDTVEHARARSAREAQQLRGLLARSVR